MVTKKREQTQEELYWPAKLVISREEFRTNIQDRIEKWNEIYKRQVSTQEQFEILKWDYNKWNEWNQQFLRVSFNYEQNRYLEQYSFWCGVVMWGYDYNEVREKKKDIQEKVERLEVLLEQIDLIPIQETTIPEIQNNSQNNTAIKTIKQILWWFHKCAQELRHRHTNRDTLILSDEYDVQDLLRSILKVFYSDVRAEDYAPSSAWWNSRIDLILPDESIILETKMTNEKLRDKDVWEQIAIDIVRYQNHPSYKTLVVFIYDKWDFIRNKRGLINDLEKQSRNGKEIVVMINPE